MIRCTIHQPNYLPWLGFFEKVSQSDVFIIYDNAQYVKNDWQNRNKIRTKEGWIWLTLPVSYNFGDRINKVKISDKKALQKHWKSIIANYSKTKYFKKYKEEIREIYEKDYRNLAELNIVLIKKLIQILGIDCEIKLSSELVPGLKSKSTKALIELCKAVNADEYISGQDGEKYIDLNLFKKNNIKVSFQKYNHPLYPQQFEGFEPGMCILDLLFNHGSKSLEILKKKRLKIGVFAYNVPHRKTQEYLTHLFLNDIKIDCILAADFVKLNFYQSKIRVILQGMHYTHPRKIAEKLNIPYHVVIHSSKECEDLIEKYDLDLGIIAGARILKENVVNKFKIGILNMHPGLLPEFRGLDPFKWAILKKAKQGVTCHLIDKYVDRGKIIIKQEMDVYEDDTLIDIDLRLQNLGKKMMIDCIKILGDGKHYFEQVGKGTRYPSVPPGEESKLLEKFENYKKIYSKLKYPNKT